MIPSIATQWENQTYKERSVYEVNELPSETVPDQSMSLREMVRRHQAGLPVPAGQNPIWDETDDLPDMRRLDLSEIQDYKDLYLEKIKSIDDNQKTIRQKKAEKAELDKIEALKQKWLSEQETKSTNTP